MPTLAELQSAVSQLRRSLGELIEWDAQVFQSDATCWAVARCVFDATRSLVLPEPAKADLPQPRLLCTFRPQACVSGYISDLGRNVEFDATTAFLRQSAADIRDFKEHDYCSDCLASGLPVYEEHHGPFEVDVEPGLSSFMEDNGVSNYHEITDEQLQALRQKYGVDPEA